MSLLTLDIKKIGKENKTNEVISSSMVLSYCADQFKCRELTNTSAWLNFTKETFLWDFESHETIKVFFFLS